jgi:hypothetical protein
MVTTTKAMLPHITQSHPWQGIGMKLDSASLAWLKVAIG